jgi:hypothetical protein
MQNLFDDTSLIGQKIYGKGEKKWRKISQYYTNQPTKLSGGLLYKIDPIFDVKVLSFLSFFSKMERSSLIINSISAMPRRKLDHYNRARPYSLVGCGILGV